MGRYLTDILAGKGIETHVTTRSDVKSDRECVKYIRGDAHDKDFVKSLLKSGYYDALVDFMIYSTPDFRERSDMLLNSTGHYLYFSSSRVYADSEHPIRETSPRLLDAGTDAQYLRTDEYALAKARQENILRESHAKNWTIIRPYITYSNERLQLGVYEKECWLWRAVHNKPVIFSDDIADTVTTLTWGYDAAQAIAGLTGRAENFGGTFHITGDECMKWRDIAEIYTEVFMEAAGRELRIKYIPEALNKTPQVKYDRLFRREFDNSKIKNAVPEFKPVTIREGLTKCLTEFVRDNHPFRAVSVVNEAALDRIAGCCARSDEFPDAKARAVYLVYRYIPALAFVIKLCRRILRRLLRNDSH